jgi:hypothetical protein
MDDRVVTGLALVLLAALILPGLLLGLMVAPWFFLLMLLAAVVPLFFLIRSAPTDGEAREHQ